MENSPVLWLVFKQNLVVHQNLIMSKLSMIGRHVLSDASIAPVD